MSKLRQYPLSKAEIEAERHQTELIEKGYYAPRPPPPPIPEVDWFETYPDKTKPSTEPKIRLKTGISDVKHITIETIYEELNLNNIVRPFHKMATKEYQILEGTPQEFVITRQNILEDEYSEKLYRICYRLKMMINVIERQINANTDSEQIRNQINHIKDYIRMVLRKYGVQYHRRSYSYDVDTTPEIRKFTLAEERKYYQAKMFRKMRLNRGEEDTGIFGGGKKFEIIPELEPPERKPIDPVPYNKSFRLLSDTPIPQWNDIQFKRLLCVCNEFNQLLEKAINVEKDYEENIELAEMRHSGNKLEMAIQQLQKITSSLLEGS